MGKLSIAQLDELVEQATIDCYNEDEAVTGFYTMLEDELQTPFETVVLGVPVTVTRVDLSENSDTIVAVCRRGALQQRIDILDLSLPTPPPAGARWIEAYRHWIR